MALYVLLLILNPSYYCAVLAQVN